VSRPLTILHLSSDFHAGGSTISIALLAGAQRAAGHRVLVGCREGSGLAAQARASDLEVVALEFGRTGAAARAIAALARETGADVINAHASRDRAACRRARFGGRLPQALVMTRRVMPRSTWLSALASALAADRVIAVSAAVARALARRGTPRRRLDVVPNAVDWRRLERAPRADDVARARALAGAAPDRPTIGIVSRRKNQDVAVRALARLAVPVTLCCLGIDVDDGLAAAAAAAHARGHVVTFVPFQPDVRPFYAVFDLALLPSVSEGCSQALLEAMALGTPVVAARGGGNSDLIEDRVTGLLADPAPAGLAAAVARQLLDSESRERMAKTARRHVAQHYDVAHTLEGTQASYAAALARRGRAA